MEIWKDIPHYEGLYQVSNIGNVKSLSRQRFMPNGCKSVYNDKILKPNNRRGYVYVNLHKNRKQIKFNIHRLVAIAFINNDKNFATINHINGIKTDNRIDNLEWCSVGDNNRHAVLTGLNKPKLGSKNHMFGKKGKDAPRSKIVINLENGIFYESCTEAAKIYGINYKLLVSYLNNVRKNKTSLRYA